MTTLIYLEINKILALNKPLEVDVLLKMHLVEAYTF